MGGWDGWFPNKVQTPQHKNTPKISFFGPNFTFCFPKSHRNPWVGWWVYTFGKTFQKRLFTPSLTQYHWNSVLNSHSLKMPCQSTLIFVYQAAGHFDKIAACSNAPWKKCPLRSKFEMAMITAVLRNPTIFIVQPTTLKKNDSWDN